MPHVTRSASLSDHTGNGYGFTRRATAHEDDAPTYEQTRSEITAAFLHLAATGERPAPEALARMHAGLRRGVGEGKAKPPALPRDPVVYYFRVGNRIKIGHTGQLAGRIKSLAPEEVLGWEPGPVELERRRHEQFAAHRVAREWFEDCPAIRRHLATLAN